jgi:hypothetical protein
LANGIRSDLRFDRGSGSVSSACSRVGNELGQPRRLHRCPHDGLNGVNDRVGIVDRDEASVCDRA